jgi:hypothetical protein
VFSDECPAANRRPARYPSPGTIHSSPTQRSNLHYLHDLQAGSSMRLFALDGDGTTDSDRRRCIRWLTSILSVSGRTGGSRSRVAAAVEDQSSPGKVFGSVCVFGE